MATHQCGCTGRGWNDQWIRSSDVFTRRRRHGVLAQGIVVSRFPAIVVNDRLHSVRQRLDEVDCDALLVASMTNVRYLTGFTGSAGIAVVATNGGVLCVDGRYGQQATEQLENSSCDLDVVVVKTATEMNEVVVRVMSALRQVAYDATEFTVAQFDGFAGAAGTLSRHDGIVARIREVKDDGEVSRIAFAASCADTALSVLPEILGRHGAVTERDVRDELEYAMRRAGADGPSYDTIVASGENAALPHHRPSSRIIQEGDSLVIDVGALVEGYHSDMTRTYLVGDCDRGLHEMFDTVREVQAAAVEMVAPGVQCGAIDTWCRAEFARRNVEQLIMHSTGHGVGLMIHESPWIRAGFEDQLQPGQVVTVEPGLYRVGVGGVRIEDLLVVTQTGHTVLTHSPKESPCLQSPPTT